MMHIKLFSRRDCSLCQQAINDLESLKEQYPHQVEVIDIDQNPKLRKEYREEIPVVEIGPYILKAPFGVQTLQMTLAAAKDRLKHIEQIDALPI